MSQNSVFTVKLIGVIVAAVVLIGGAVASSRDYSDKGDEKVVEKQDKINAKLEGKVDAIQSSVNLMAIQLGALTATIEERLPKKR